MNMKMKMNRKRIKGKFFNPLVMVIVKEVELVRVRVRVS
jgi:hypothetical protein